MAAVVALYRPAHVDHSQSAHYRHVATRVEADGSLVAVFADGSEGPSAYPNVAAMLAAGERDWRERMIPVLEGGR